MSVRAFLVASDGQLEHVVDLVAVVSTVEVPGVGGASYRRVRAGDPPHPIYERSVFGVDRHNGVGV